MKDKKCYINSAVQVSCQLPLQEEWLVNPQLYGERYVRAQEPDVKAYVSAGEARRMSRILKRATATSLEALRRAAVEMPDAVITGTGMGCMENSEKFLIDMANFGENSLKPTLFMQSTHNTISSQISILLKCHGYNNTYSHRGISFDSALFDAFLQLRLGRISTALVGSHDEVTPLMARFMRGTQPDYNLISESSVAMVVSDQDAGALCEVERIEILHRPKEDELLQAIEHCMGEDGALMLGLNGNPLNDAPYEKILAEYQDIPVLTYRNVFGDNFSSSATAVYAAAHMLKEGRYPDAMVMNGGDAQIGDIRSLTLVHHSGGADWAVIKLLSYS